MKFAYVLAMCVAAVAAQGAGDPIRCHTGVQMVGLVDSGLVYTTMFESLCRPDQDHCTNLDYYLETDSIYGVAVNFSATFGYCASSAEEVTCENTVPYVEGENDYLRFCFSQTCDTTPADGPCNGGYIREPVTSCEPSVDPYDTQLFPKCTFQQSVTSTIGCLSEVLAQHPYDDADQCRAKWDEAVECLFRLVPNCLLSHCPSILDHIPGFRSEFNTAALAASTIRNVSSLDSLISQITGVNTLPSGYDILCPSASSPRPVFVNAVDTILAVLGNIVSTLDLDGALTGTPVDVNCQGLLTELAEAELRFIHEFLIAESSEQVSAAVHTLEQSFDSSVGTCNLSGSDEGRLFYSLLTFFFNNLHQIFPPTTTTSTTTAASTTAESTTTPVVTSTTTPVVTSTTTPVVTSTTTPVVTSTTAPTATPTVEPAPNGRCPQPGQAIRFECGQLYQDETLCGQRRAWLCDYADWKLHFLGGWVQQFENFSGQDYSAWIPECPDNTEVQCTASQRCCVRSAGGCELCFCQGHDYTDLSGVLTWWRRDYRSWQAFFRAYRDQIATGGFPTGGTC